MPRTLKRAIAFIDRNVDDLGTLLAAISSHVEPILLSNDEPAPRQMVRAVNRRADLDAIHVIATDGRVRCRSEPVRCRWTRRGNTRPILPKWGACCAVAQFTCGPARQRG
jgi:Domain of unknown function (DUF4347)